MHKTLGSNPQHHKKKKAPPADFTVTAFPSSNSHLHNTFLVETVLC